MVTEENRHKKVREAELKEVEYGSSIDLDLYNFDSDAPRNLESLDNISPSERSLLSEVGFDTDQVNKSGSFVQFDNESIFADVMLMQQGLEIMPITEALQKYEWLSEYLWNTVSVDADKYTVKSELEVFNGYFVRAKAGAKIALPVQNCIILKKDKTGQNVHNIIIAEENSEMHIITECASPSDVERSLHLSVSEIFVKKNASLSFTMIHKWSETIDVRPRSAAIIEQGGVFISNYAILSPLKSIQTVPEVRLTGLGAKADLYSVICSSKSSEYDIGGLLSFEAPKSNGKIISRAIATDQSFITARGELVGHVSDTKARLECDGLLLSDEAVIRAVPILHARAEGTELSHEATIGKVGAEQLNYLMSRGFSEEEATLLIVSGFIKLKVPDLPVALQSSIDEVIRLSLQGGM